MARILLVEDDPVMAEMIKDVLQSGGHHVALAPDGVAALIHLGVTPPEEVQKQTGITDWKFVGNEWSADPAKKVMPELIVSDCMMPRLDGFTLINHLAGDEDAIRSIPVIVLTTKAKMEDPFKQLANVKGFIAKPADPDQLLAMVSQSLGKS